MSEILKRPDYVTYDTFYYDQNGTYKENILKLEEEPILAQWSLPRAFMWNSSAWVHHTLILFLPVILTIWSYLAFGFTYMPITITIVVTFVFGTLFYFGRSQYYHVGYKISKSGILIDNLKVYPRFRYGNQDPTNFLRALRIVAIFLVIFALLVNPYYLIGAGSAIFLSFMKPQIDSGELALYKASLWKSKKSKKPNYSKINIIAKRRIIYLELVDKSDGCPIFCNKDNFEEVVFLIKQFFPNAEYVQNERIF